MMDEMHHCEAFTFFYGAGKRFTGRPVKREKGVGNCRHFESMVGTERLGSCCWSILLFLPPCHDTNTDGATKANLRFKKLIHLSRFKKTNLVFQRIGPENYSGK